MADENQAGDRERDSVVGPLADLGTVTEGGTKLMGVVPPNDHPVGVGLGFGLGADPTDLTMQTIGDSDYSGGSGGDWGNGGSDGGSSWAPTTDYSDNPDDGLTFGGGTFDGGGSGGDWSGGADGGAVTQPFATQQHELSLGQVGSGDCSEDGSPPRMGIFNSGPADTGTTIDYQNGPGLCTPIDSGSTDFQGIPGGTNS